MHRCRRGIDDRDDYVIDVPLRHKAGNGAHIAQDLTPRNHRAVLLGVVIYETNNVQLCPVTADLAGDLDTRFSRSDQQDRLGIGVVFGSQAPDFGIHALGEPNSQQPDYCQQCIHEGDRKRDSPGTIGEK